jgi:serine phosphatase RsbU (regulator of sigma subunit)/anti-sigma regulatory factor (Ser/Thr protein kinase)
MNAIAATWQRVLGRGRPEAHAMPAQDAVVREPQLWVEVPPVEIAPNDPIVAYLQSASGAVDLETLDLDSPACRVLRAAGVRLVVPLVSQGELIGSLNLGPRLSEQEYSTDDRKLLENLAAQAAPAVRVGQLVRQQEAEVRARERIEHELQVARLIQQHFLPREVPVLPGWTLAALYRPARAVGGDFYDFIHLAEGRLGIVIGDVTDKGVPAALVMAATRSVLRAAAQRELSPGKVLAQVNDLLCPDTPPNMFVTCLYAVLDPTSGRLRYANAGHDVPYAWSAVGPVELRARGMPLGLMPGMTYEEKEATLAPGQNVVLYSDGLVEAHNPQRAMFGFPRLKELVGAHPGGGELIELLLGELDSFTGPSWEQEDDVTLVILQRQGPTPDALHAAPNGSAAGERLLAEFTVPSQPGNERPAMQQVADAVRDLSLPPARLERLKTAVAEAIMNAIEHGNQNRAELPVVIRVTASVERVAVRVSDRGGKRGIPENLETPDLEAKLAGLQKPRGWGLYLIKNMVDEMHVSSDTTHHTVELVLRLANPGGGTAA